MIIAVPFGLIMAIYLSEYAKPAVRETVKPALEMLEAVPTVVYGYFALLVMTPFLQQFIPGLKGINLLVPGIILGIMILPYVVSVRGRDARRAQQPARGRLCARHGEMAGGDPHRHPRCVFGHHRGLHPRHVARGGRDDGAGGRRRTEPEPDMGPARGGGDDHRLYRADEPW